MSLIVRQEAHSCRGEEEEGCVCDLVFGDIFQCVIEERLKVIVSDGLWFLAKGRYACLR